MDIYFAIEKRRSVRFYKDKPVLEDSLTKILEAARLAPTAHNAQDFKLIVVKDEEKRKAISLASYGQRFIAEASIVIVAVSLNPNYVTKSGIPASHLDLAIVLDHISLAAMAEKLGTCWVAVFSQEEVKKILKIPEEYKIIAMMTLGVASDLPGVKTRKHLTQLVCFDEFSEIK